MHTDDLISKYLDGELTQEEDIILRETMYGDSSAKDAFDTAVIIHGACLDDAASIAPSEELIQATEDRVLMKILAQQPIFSDTVYKRRRYYALSTLVAVFLCLSVIRINELTLPWFNIGNTIITQMNLEKKKIQNEQEQSQELLIYIPKDKNQNLASAKIHFSKPEKNNIYTLNPNSAATLSAITSSAATENNQNINAENKPVANTLTEEKITTPSYPGLSAKLNDNLTAEVKNPKLLNFNLSRTLNNNDTRYSMSQIDFFPRTSEIQLTSFLGTDLVSDKTTKRNQSLAANFSQSLAYSFNPSQRLGVEFGYANFTYDDKVSVNVPLPTDINNQKITMSSVEVLTQDKGLGSGSFEFPATISRDKQVLWGAAFFEHEFVNYNNFALNGRLGIGASSDGALAFGKVFARYRLFSIVNLTLGAEFKSYQAKLTMLNSTEDILKYNMSLIYGFQIKF